MSTADIRAALHDHLPADIPQDLDPTPHEARISRAFRWLHERFFDVLERNTPKFFEGLKDLFKGREARRFIERVGKEAGLHECLVILNLYKKQFDRWQKIGKWVAGTASTGVGVLAGFIADTLLGIAFSVNGAGAPHVTTLLGTTEQLAMPIAALLTGFLAYRIFSKIAPMPSVYLNGKIEKFAGIINNMAKEHGFELKLETCGTYKLKPGLARVIKRIVHRMYEPELIAAQQEPVSTGSRMQLPDGSTLWTAALAHQNGWGR